MESSPGFLEVVQEGGLDLLVGADAERADEHVGLAFLRLVDCGDDGVDLLDGVVGIAADLEVDERCTPGLADLAVLGIERRLDVHDHVHCRDFGDHVFDQAVKAGSPRTVSVSLWMSTLSPAGCTNSSWRSLSMRPDSPTPEVAGSILVVPLRMPAAKATTTKASQPKIAVLRCCAPSGLAPGEVGGTLDSSGGSTRLSGVLGSSESR